MLGLVTEMVAHPRRGRGYRLHPSGKKKNGIPGKSNRRIFEMQCGGFMKNFLQYALLQIELTFILGVVIFGIF